MKRLEAINDFVIKFANVNGSGSASANELLDRKSTRLNSSHSDRSRMPSSA